MYIYFVWTVSEVWLYGTLLYELSVIFYVFLVFTTHFTITEQSEERVLCIFCVLQLYGFDQESTELPVLMYQRMHQMSSYTKPTS